MSCVGSKRNRCLLHRGIEVDKATTATPPRQPRPWVGRPRPARRVAHYEANALVKAHGLINKLLPPRPARCHLASPRLRLRHGQPWLRRSAPRPAGGRRATDRPRTGRGSPFYAAQPTSRLRINIYPAHRETARPFLFVCVCSVSNSARFCGRSEMLLCSDRREPQRPSWLCCAGCAARRPRKPPVCMFFQQEESVASALESTVMWWWSVRGASQRQSSARATWPRQCIVPRRVPRPPGEARREQRL